MTGNQPCNFGHELDPLAGQNADGFDGAGRNAVAAARAGRNIDDRSPCLAREDANGAVIANFRATAAGHTLLFDADVRSGQSRHQPRLLLIHSWGGRIVGYFGKKGR